MAEPRQAGPVLLLSVPLHTLHSGQAAHSHQGLNDNDDNDIIMMMIMMRFCLPGLGAADDPHRPAVSGPENGEASNPAN